MARIESAIRTVLDFEKALNPFNRSTITAMLCEDCTVEDSQPAPTGSTYIGKAAVLAFLEDEMQNKRKMRKIENVSGLGDRCLVFWATDKRGVDIYRVVNNQVRERLSYVKE